MFIADPMPVPADNRRFGRLRRWVRGLMCRWGRHRALQAWARDLPRPTGCARVPARVWRRHSALLSLGRPTPPESLP